MKKEKKILSEWKKMREKSEIVKVKRMAKCQKLFAAKGILRQRRKAEDLVIAVTEK